MEVNNLANYLLSPGDTLEITVWKEEGLQQQQYLISPDGTIIYPLIGTVLAAGKTITELKDNISSKLADYISEPSITVKLLGFQGNSIFVIGKVTRPGQFYTARKIDVLQALSLAGGLTVFADDNSISILRRVGNEVKVFPFDYSDVIKGNDLEQNILLEPGDTVTVP
ncbi:polysaccharide export protein [Methylomonas paludis]|uniref:Polysaccharide export protein n=1 Tax=Methylomonas paludis TaxID=1173101 RepID=A0A975MRQ0_9GAMM|nr:polysaccharide export protein [Methylomonas paludis]